jgi:ATP-dependent DNA ligase
LYVDGELMAYDADGHAIPLQTISGMARNAKKAHQTILDVFDVFDCCNMQQPFSARLVAIARVIPKTPATNPPLVRRVPTTRMENERDAARAHARFLASGFEGSVFREPDSIYVPSYGAHRSTTTIKWKPIHRMELEVVGWAGGKKGKSVKLVRWTLKVNDETTLTLDPKWPDALRRKFYDSLTDDPKLFDKKYRGKMMTIEYQDLSLSGVPLRAKAVAFRDDI